MPMIISEFIFAIEQSVKHSIPSVWEYKGKDHNSFMSFYSPGGFNTPFSISTLFCMDFLNEYNIFDVFFAFSTATK